MLVVMVIIPLIIGALAAALIVSFDNESSTSSRISDSVNAQVTSAYFVRDVEGALEITTDAALYSSGGYTQVSPQICGTPTAGTFLIGFYRPASSSASFPALDTAYWISSPNTSSAELDRYSCTVNSSYQSVSPSVTAVASIPAAALGGTTPAAAITETAVISPTQFASLAAQSWTSTVAETITGNTTPIILTASPQPIPVASLTGFTVSGTFQINIATNLGSVPASCTGSTSGAGTTAFTGCTLKTGWVGNATILAASTVTQSSVTGVQLSVSEPGSSYRYNLFGSPRAASLASQLFPQASNAGLLLFAQGGLSMHGNAGVSSYCPYNGGNNAKVCVNAGIQVDGGKIDCGSGNIYGSAYQSTAAGVCGLQNFTVVQQTFPDPIAPYLPTCFATTESLGSPINGPQTGTVTSPLKPGIYAGSVSGVLEPGVYVLEGGGSTLSMVSPTGSAQTDPNTAYFEQNSSGAYDTSSGVLIYLPGPQAAQGCITANAPTISGSVALVPLSTNQSTWWFGGNKIFGDMWLWQDQSNNSGTTLDPGTPICITNSNTQITPQNAGGACPDKNGQGLAAVTPCPTTASPTVYEGLAYAPGATFSGSGNENVFMGRMYVGALGPLSGTPQVNLSGC